MSMKEVEAVIADPRGFLPGTADGGAAGPARVPVRT